MGKDTEFQRRHGLSYSKLAAADAGVPVRKDDPSRFNTDHTRRNQEEVIRILTEENARLIQEKTALQKALDAAVKTIRVLESK